MPSPCSGYVYACALSQAPQDWLQCQLLLQPPRFNQEPVTFLLMVTYNATFAVTVQWPDESELLFVPPPSALPPSSRCTAPVVTAWPTDFDQAWLNDIAALDGEAEAVFPVSGRRRTLIKKEAEESDCELELVVEWLEERYQTLGIHTHRQSFAYRAGPRANLIATVPGLDATLPPIVVADHIDTAFAGDVFALNQTRVAVPGADDNGSATATLLRLAALISQFADLAGRLQRTILLVHLTGEEYPADDLGARHLVSDWLTHGRDVAAIVLMDMISWRQNASDGLFQISAGSSNASLAVARCAFDVASVYINQFTPMPIKPAFRAETDPRQYLYNTDGALFSWSGFPVILINEHINRLEHLDRHHYHETTDALAFMDPAFGASVARVAIETVLHLATQ
jgi:hypothetical protein